MAASGELRPHLYEYRARTRYIPLMVTAAWACAGTGLYAWMMVRFGRPPAFEDQLGFCAPWLLLMALGFGAQLLANRRLRPIEVTREGIWVGGQGRPGARFLPWSKIERVHRIRSSGTPARTFLSKHGVYVWESGGRPLMIYEPICGFEDLWREIQEQMTHRSLTAE